MRELAPGIRLLNPADYRRMRWKNGRGWTTEIAVSPLDAGLNGQAFGWRISLAEIDNDGDFSRFPGYDRTIVLADGAGMELSFDAAPTQRLVERYASHRLKGEWRTRCHLLNGPVRDFNVMSSRATYQHQCEIICDAAVSVPAVSAARMLMLYVFQGEATVGIAGQDQFNFTSGETLCFSAAQARRELRVAVRGVAATIAVTGRPETPAELAEVP